MFLKSITTNWKRLYFTENFCLFFYSNPTQNSYSKTNPKPNLNPNSNLNLLTLTQNKANEKSADEYFSFSFYSH